MLRVASVFLFALTSQCHSASAHSDRMSRHLLVEDLSMVVLVADAEQTQGPFPGQDESYISTPDLTVTALAGSPGLEADRSTVLEGIPVNLTINIYDVSDGVRGVEFENVVVTIWSCDTIGVYSAVSDGDFFQPNVVGVNEQIWLRGRQVTGADGSVMFQTIMPGWYSDRSIHYHIRLRFPGEQDFAATTQVYVCDDDLLLYQDVEPYVSNSMTAKTPLATDFIYNELDPVVGEMLQLDLEGSAETGFSASINLGLVPGAVSKNPGPWTFPPALAPLVGGNNTMTDGEGGVVVPTSPDGESETTPPTSDGFFKKNLVMTPFFVLGALLVFVAL